MKKIKNNEVVEYFKNNGRYNLLEEYRTYNTPIKIEKDGYISTISYAHFKNGGRPIFFGTKCEYFKENIKLYINRKNKNIEFLDAQGIKKSGKYRILVSMKCECGVLFQKTWEHIYKDNVYLCCKDCARKQQTKTRRKKNNKQYLSFIEKNGYELVDKKQDLFSEGLVEVIEKNTGYRGFVNCNYVNKQKKMIVFSLFTNKKNLVYNLNQYANNNNIKTHVIRLFDDDKLRTQAIECKCECGDIYITTYKSFLNQKWACDKCSQKISKNEIILKNFLEESNIDYIYEYSINSCKDVLPLKFDFYLKKYKVLIEVDGGHHFQPVNFGGNMDEKTLYLRYLNYQKRDKIKDEFCKENNIPLLRIKYTEFNNGNYKKTINEFIQTVQF